MLAISSEHVKIARMLIDAGADVNAKDKNGLTALMRAVPANYTDIVKVLLDKGANPNETYQDGDTILIAAVYKINYRIAEMLLKNGADVNAKNYRDKTAMWHAVFKQYDGDMIELLLKAGADASTKDENGFTALMQAIAIEEYHTAEVLLKFGAAVNAKDMNGWTALAVAVLGDIIWNPDFIAKLLAAGADVNAKNIDERTIWADMVDRFTSGKSEFRESGYEDYSVVMMILDKAHVNSDLDPWFETAALGDYELIEMFLKAGVNVNAKSKKSNAWTALMVAASKGHKNTVQVLLKAGANAAATDNRGATAAEIAADNGYKKLAALINYF